MKCIGCEALRCEALCDGTGGVMVMNV
jgi:hypothetical protein